MRKLTRSILATTAVASLLALPVAGAGAAQTGDTTVSFTVGAAASSALAIAQGGTTSTLDDGGTNPVFDVANAGSVSGTLPATTISDQRGTLAAPWKVEVEALTDWQNTADDTVTVPATGATAYLDVLQSTLEGDLVTGGMLLTGATLAADVSGVNLGTKYTLLSGTTTLGNGTFTYTPAVDVAVPAGTPQGTYEAVVRQTVS